MAMGNNNKKMNILLFLPAEICTDIFCRLPIPSIILCKLVCKTWLALIENPVFIDTYMHGPVTSSVGVILHEHSHNEKGQEVFQFAEYNDDDDYNPMMLRSKVYKVSIPIYPYLFSCRYLIGSCNGLICFRSRGFSSKSRIEDICTQVCNPFTGEYAILPTLSFSRECNCKFVTDYVASGFGYHISTKEYKVVRIVYRQCQGPVGHVFVYTLGSTGTGCWRSKGEIKHLLFSSSDPNSNSIGYNVNGALHWLNEKMEIFSFDLAVEEFRTLLPSPPITLPPSPSLPPLWVAHLYYGCNLGLPTRRLPLPPPPIPIPQFAQPPTRDVHGYYLGVLEGCLCMSMTTKVREQEELNTWVMLMNKESKEYSWVKKFSITCKNICYYVPFAILKSGRILLRYNGMYIHSFDPKNIGCYDPKTKSFTESYVEDDWKRAEMIPYMRSFVSLKSMGEKTYAAQGNI